MNTSDLERIIIDEVMKALSEQRGDETLLPAPQSETLDANACKSPACSCEAKPEDDCACPPKADGPAVLVIFTGAREPWQPNVEAFQRWRSDGVQIDAVFSPDAVGAFSIDELSALGVRLIDRVDEIQAMRQDMGRYAAVYMPSVCRNHAAKLALAITDDAALKITIAALAHKVPVIASSEGLDKDACIIFGNNVPGVQDVLDKYRIQLGTMGVKLLPTCEALDKVLCTATNKANNESSELITFVITEEDAAKLNGPVVKAARGGLITPLAMESLIRRGIEVVIVPPQ